MAEFETPVDLAVYVLEWRAEKYEDYFARPELALVLCHTRESNRKALISLALAGHARAHSALLGMAQFLTAVGDPLPRWLQEYFFSTPQPPKRRSKSRDPRLNFVRDALIGQTVAFVARTYEIRPTRNPAARSRASACSIVTQALKRQGIHMTEANVNGIWQRFRKDDLLYLRYKRRQVQDAVL